MITIHNVVNLATCFAENFKVAATNSGKSEFLVVLLLILFQINALSYFYSVRQKVSPKLFAIFLATARNFQMNFHTFITDS